MRKEVTVSLIIATYNWPEALELCLESISKQTILPSEIIIADDGSGSSTQELIQKISSSSVVPIYHVWHEDKGFRLSLIRNKAIRQATSTYIIQIDGDIIVNSHFIEDHLNMAEEGCFIRGTRVNLSSQATEKVLKNKEISLPIKLQLMINHPANAIRLHPHIVQLTIRKESSGKRVKGCNMSFWKKDLAAINGYNNDLQGWGHEDEELSWRLVNLGRQKKIIKFSAIAYHLYHKQLSREEEPHHRDFMQTIKEEKLTRTNNGLEEI